MTIPNDPIKRWWVDVTVSNPKLINLYRPTLAKILPFDLNGKASTEGCGFIIGSGENGSLVITAKHIFTEGVFKKQTPNPSYDPTSPFIPKSATLPKIEPKDLKIVWANSNTALLMNCIHLSYAESSDVACCVIVPDGEDKTKFKPAAVPLDVRVPTKGDVVRMISHTGMSVEMSEHSSPKTMAIKSGVNIRVGVVTSVYPKGYSQFKWPCFTTSIPAEPGMSGGYITYPEDGETIGACGIVCADVSKTKARKNQLLCGESIIAYSWPALALSVLGKTIYELMHEGYLSMAIGGIDEIDLIPLGNGDYRIHNRGDHS